MGLFDFFRKKEEPEELDEKDLIKKLEINFQNRDDYEEDMTAPEESEWEKEKSEEESFEESKRMREDYRSYADYDDYLARPYRDSFYDDER